MITLVCLCQCAQFLSISSQRLLNQSSNLRMMLKRMVEDGQIEKSGRGEYGVLSPSSHLPEE